MKKINSKHKKTIDIYLSNGMNKTQALIDAGYSKKYAGTNAKQVFDRPEVAAYLAQEQAKAAKKLDITKEYIINEYMQLLNSCKEEGLDGAGTIKDRANWNKTLMQLTKMLGLDEPTKVEIAGELGINLNIPGITSEEDDEESEEVDN